MPPIRYPRAANFRLISGSGKRNDVIIHRTRHDPLDVPRPKVERRALFTREIVVSAIQKLARS
jgi:hypothetical protein